MLKRVLVLEDSFFMRQEIVSWLKNTSVKATNSPHQAMTWLTRQTFDYCVVNAFLKDYTGLEFIYEVNTWPDFGGVRFILISFEKAYFEQADWSLESLGVVGVLHPLELKKRLVRGLR